MKSITSNPSRPVVHLVAIAIFCLGVRADARIIFEDDFGLASRGERVKNLVGEPPPLGMGYPTDTPFGYTLKNWVIADSEPDKQRRAFWCVPEREDGTVETYAQQSARSHDSIAYIGTPVPAGATHYVIEFRQWANDNDYLGFILGASEPVMDHDGIEFGYERQIPGTDETVPEIYYRGALGRGRINDQALMRQWVRHRIEVRGQHVRWSQNDEVLLAGAVARLRPGGRFGIRQRYERGTRYDDVRVTVMSEQTAEADTEDNRHHPATVSHATWNAEDQRPELDAGWSAVGLLPGETDRVPLLQWWSPLRREGPAVLRFSIATSNREPREVEVIFEEGGDTCGTVKVPRAEAFRDFELELTAGQVRRAIDEGVRLKLSGGDTPLWMVWRHDRPGVKETAHLPGLVQVDPPGR